MTLLIKNITEFNLLKGTKIVAGTNGINNEIQWINVMEILDNIDDLQKNDLLITTGYELDNENLYKDIIFKLKNKELSGIAIQTGFYIDKIPEYIKKDGDRFDFPVIEIPHNITLSQITHVLIENINLQFSLGEDFDLVLLKNKLNDIKSSKIKHLFDTQSDVNFHIFLLSIWSDYNSIITGNLIPETVSKLKTYFEGITDEVQIEQSGKKILFIVPLKNDFIIQYVIFDIFTILKLLSKKFKMIFLMGESKIKNFNEIDSAFDNAILSEETLRKIGAQKGICPFDDINIFKFIEILNYNDYSTKFAYETLKSLIEYDLIHKSYYLDTLRFFLISNCNLTETSAKLFIHRHTLKNRLDKIEELCSIDFKNYYSRIRFSLAILIYDLFIN